MLQKFKKYLIKNENAPSYPPYHTGDYLEQYFFNFYLKNQQQFELLKYKYIPVLWTDLYLYSPTLIDQLQKDLNELDENCYYFTVSQHDDAPYQNLPKNTVKFSAGGNIPNCIPIPLICSPIPNIPNLTQKDVFCSFVGSITQPIQGWGKISYDIRMKMLEALVNNPDYILKPKHWSPEIKQDRKDLFLDITARSKFTLCPRGYGASSFRLYEAIQLKSVPIYIYYQKPYLPFSSKINWNDAVILINENEISEIDQRLKSISDEKYHQMINYGQEIYPKFFTLEGMCANILEDLKSL
jgi:hypothetical protein